MKRLKIQKGVPLQQDRSEFVLSCRFTIVPFVLYPEASSKMKTLILILFVSTLATSLLFAQQPKTLSLKPGERGGPARIEDVAWLAGYWKGEGLGGVSEEFWTPPSGESMTGLFRLVKDGKTVFQEIFIIVEEGDTLILKLKHFNPDLTGWEEKEKTIDFPLVRVAPDEAFFDGLTYRKLQNDELQIFLKLRMKNGEIKEEEFRFTRERGL